MWKLIIKSIPTLIFTGIMMLWISDIEILGFVSIIVFWLTLTLINLGVSRLLGVDNFIGGRCLPTIFSVLINVFSMTVLDMTMITIKISSWRTLFIFALVMTVFNVLIDCLGIINKHKIQMEDEYVTKRYHHPQGDRHYDYYRNNENYDYYRRNGNYDCYRNDYNDDYQSNYRK